MDELAEQMCDPMVEYVKGLRDNIADCGGFYFFGLRSLRKGWLKREERPG